MKIVILAGGVGGARMARGFDALESVELTVIVNVADDDEIYGLHVSPDIDSVLYGLAGIDGSEGWGRAGDSWTVMTELGRFGTDTAFRIGDLDLANNLFRTDQLSRGTPLSEITRRQGAAFGIRSEVLPATDAPVRTRVETKAGESLDFQTYFVRRGHSDAVDSVVFDGVDDARPAPGVLAAVAAADVVVIAPSNPILSIWPILAVAGIRDAVAMRPVLAVSPLIGGRPVKGPAADLLSDHGFTTDADGVVEVYGGLLDRIVVHHGDEPTREDVVVHAADILMPERRASRRLAEEIVEWLG